MSEQALWQRLALSRDRLCASRFLGSFSPEARQVVTTEDPRPYLSTARFVPGADGDVGTIDWKEVGVNGGGGLCCLWVCCLMFWKFCVVLAHALSLSEQSMWSL